MTDGFEESRAFWNTVGKSASYDLLEVGGFLMVEDHRFGTKRRRPVIITDITPNPEHGRPNITFRPATDAETEAAGENYLLLIAGERAQ